jgi:hypothetical protein
VISGIQFAKEVLFPMMASPAWRLNLHFAIADAEAYVMTEVIGSGISIALRVRASKKTWVAVTE